MIQFLATRNMRKVLTSVWDVFRPLRSISIILALWAIDATKCGNYTYEYHKKNKSAAQASVTVGVYFLLLLQCSKFKTYYVLKSLIITYIHRIYFVIAFYGSLAFIVSTQLVSKRYKNVMHNIHEVDLALRSLGMHNFLLRSNLKAYTFGFRFITIAAMLLASYELSYIIAFTCYDNSPVTQIAGHYFTYIIHLMVSANSLCGR